MSSNSTSMTTTTTTGLGPAATAGGPGGKPDSFMSIRQAIAGPTPPQSYAVLVKAVLRYRQKRVYILAFAGTVAAITSSALPAAGVDTCIALVYPTVWLFLAVGFLGTLPVFIARKQYLSTTPKTFPDRFGRYCNLVTSRQARLTIAAYTITSAFFSFAYVCIVTYLSPHQSYLWLTHTPGRDLLQVNERFIYISFSLLVSIIVYASQQVLRNRHVLSFEPNAVRKDNAPAPPVYFAVQNTVQTILQSHLSASQALIPSRLQARMLEHLQEIPALSASCNVSFLGLYLLFRRPALRFIIYRIPGGRVLRPYLMSMLRQNGLSYSLILASLCLSLASLALLELVNSLADIYYSQPVSVASFSLEPQRTLLDGLQSSDPYIRRFAFIELREAALAEPKRRVAIFTDIKGKTFQNSSRVCLIQLGQSYRTLQRRGRPAPASSGAANVPSQAPRSSVTQQGGHGKSVKLPISQENAFRPTQRSFLDSFADKAATATITPAVQLPPRIAESTSKVTTAAQTAISRVPSILQQKIDTKIPDEAQEAVSTAVKAVKRIEQTLLDKCKALTPAGVKSSQYWKYLFSPMLKAEIDRVLPDKDLDLCSIAAMTALMVASLHEDQYGVAQSDIPKVLEAFIKYLNTLESYNAELNKAADDGIFPSAIVREQVSQSVQARIDALRDGIVAILQTFSAYLDDIRFPLSIAKQLQNFV